jgi:hypothetical protein
MLNPVPKVVVNFNYSVVFATPVTPIHSSVIAGVAG